MKNSYKKEVNPSDRFQFGENWKSFLSVLNDERIAEAEKSLRVMLEVENLQGKTFLDIGSGSGLSSLVARRLGATVHSFDYDPQSVACTQELKHRYFADDSNWTIEQGSVLDVDYLKSLGQFDIVYSWGVLHHTGAMWQALENVTLPVANGGFLFIAIYNDQGTISKFWHQVKQFYCSGFLGKALIIASFVPYFIVRGLAKDILTLRNPTSRYIEYKKARGMSMHHDWYDWLGGYPYEVAKLEDIFRFYRNRNFVLKNLVNAEGGHANNEFVFLRQ